jgi:subtilisin family serine protease
MTLAAVTFGLAFAALPAAAWRDQNTNKIDDAIESVHAGGWNAAFVDDDPTGRMRIGVSNPENIVYAVYIGYDHKPNATDGTLLAGTGVTMVWPFLHIDYIESRATWEQIQLITALPGVTRVEAIPVEYALNHYGSRVVRARDSRGLAKADNYALFPSARQELGLDGNGIVIAILDTGVNDETDAVNPTYPGHEGLKGKFLGGGEFWCGQAECSTPPTGSANPQDHGAAVSSYHGTHCAGTAMGTGGPGGFFAGVAPGARLVDCKVLSDAGASVGGSTRGLDWCIANKNTLWAGLLPGSIWQGIDVVSMSLGSTECATGSGTSDGSGASNAAVNAAVDAGMVVVIATGNDGALDCVASPSAADKSIAVGATSHGRTLDRGDDLVTTFSNEGVRDDDGDADHFDEYKPNVVAPGAGIVSASGDPTTDGTSYQQLSGTSMAAPHVAGVVALILQANPSLTPLQLRTILQNTAEHNIPTAKASGDRGQDPYGIDANYDLGSGWGLVDTYAAAKEALNSTSGVQVVQIRGVARVPEGRIDVTWITQREYPFLGFHLSRAPDAGGAPGTFSRLTTTPILPAGDPVIQGDDNRTPYLYPDGAGLLLGQRYWYQVEWIDLLGGLHLEPPVPVDYGELARVATVFYSIAHNAVDNDLLVRIGADLDYNPGTLGQANYEVLGPGELQQDSARVLFDAGPANTVPATIGSVEHFWSVAFNQGDGADPYLPPNASHPWFLHVTDAGFVNRTGRVTSFSMFVNDAPGSAGGTTYVTDHVPMPQPTGELGLLPALLWIPEPQPTPTAVATFRAASDPSGVRLTLILTEEEPGTRATVFRSGSSDFDSRERITADPVAFSGTRFEYLDGGLEPGTYHYWVQLHRADGSSLMNGPVVTTTGAAVTLAFAPRPNPVATSTTFGYTIGIDLAAGQPIEVSISLHDLQGRVVRELKRGREGVGQYRVSWDATDGQGSRVAPGIYYARLRLGTSTHHQKVTVMR